MAKGKKKGASVCGYFRGVFEEKPEWLGIQSNDAILARYRQDHGLAAEAPVDQRIKNNLSNLKSLLRKKKRKKAARTKTAPQAVPKAAPKAGKPSLNDMVESLETLEEAIEECRNQAKNLDREGLAKAINLLRHARNEVVWQLGQ